VTKETAGVEAEIVCLVDGLTDDYEFCDEKLPEAQHKDKADLYVPGLGNCVAFSHHAQKVLDRIRHC
jgi:hypothetical protein